MSTSYIKNNVSNAEINAFNVEINATHKKILKSNVNITPKLPLFLFIYGNITFTISIF